MSMVGWVGWGSPPPASSPTFSVSRSGAQLVNGTNSPLVLHGVNIPGPEYMPVQASAIWEPGFQTDLSTMWPVVNCIRIPVNAWCWLYQATAPPTSTLVTPGNAYPNPPGSGGFNLGGGSGTIPNSCCGITYRQVITSMINRAASKGIYVILDCHWSDPYYQPNWNSYTNSSGGTSYPLQSGAGGGNAGTGGQVCMPDINVQYFWDHAAYQFRNSPWVIFEMVNEPWGANPLQFATYSPGTTEWGSYANGGLGLMIPSRGGGAALYSMTTGAGYNTAGPAGVVNITGTSITSNVATITCGVNHGLVAGQPVVIVGCTGGTSPTTYNGQWTVLAVNSLTQYTVAITSGNTASATETTGYSGAQYNYIGFQTLLNTIRSTGATNLVIMPGLKAEGELSGVTHTGYPGLPLTDAQNQLALGIHLYSLPGSGLVADTTADTNGNYPLIATELPSDDNGVYASNKGLTYPLPDSSYGTPYSWQQFVAANRPNASTIPWAFSMYNNAGGQHAMIASQTTGNPSAGFPAWPVTAVVGNVITSPAAVGYLSVGDQVVVWLGPVGTGTTSSWAATDTVQSISGSNFTLTNSGGTNYSTGIYMGTARAPLNNGASFGWAWEQWMVDTYGIGH